MTRSSSELARLVRLARSYFTREVVELRSTRVHSLLEVVAVNGRLLLNGPSVNYSFGSLHRVFEEAFVRLALDRERIDTALVLGMGAGSVVELLCRRTRPPSSITAVEIDPVVVELARKHFGIERHGNLEIVTMDASEYVAHAREQFDLIVVDLFIDAEIPAAFQTPQFLLALRDRLAPTGILLYNRLAHTTAARETSLAFARMFEATLGVSSALAVRGNMVLAHRRGAANSGAHA